MSRIATNAIYYILYLVGFSLFLYSLFFSLIIFITFRYRFYSYFVVQLFCNSFSTSCWSEGMCLMIKLQRNSGVTLSYP